MTPVSSLSPVHGLKYLMWSVWLEGLRRKEFYAFFIIALCFILTALAVRLVGVDNPATGTFVLNLGMTYCSYAAHLMVLILAARMIPLEIENRTIYPILAKPVSRLTYILGKGLATSLFGAAAFTVLLLFVWVASPRLEEYAPVLLFQLIALQVLSLFALCSMTILLSLLFPPAVSMILALLTYFFGGKAIALLELRFPSAASKWLLHYIPDFTQLNLITRYTDGMPALGTGMFFLLMAYGLVLFLSAFGFSAWVFQKRPL